jgi:transcriptional regulator with PAS, ATPase and Fis domain
LKNKNDEPINKITILNYIQNKELQNEIKTGNKYLVCKEKHDLIKYESLIKKCHFKHKSISLITDWHKDWQNNFYKTIIETGKRNLISIDESGFYLNMSKNLGRCEKGKKCYRTVHFKKKNIFFLKSRTIKNL